MIKKIYESSKSEHYFTGYYDKKVLKGNNLLVARPTFIDRMPTEQDILDIGILLTDDNEGNFYKIGATTAWNWQQSCQLSFLNDEIVGFNKRINNNICHEIVNITKDQKTIFEHPVSAYSNNGTKYLTTNYNLLSKIRPSYGYDNCFSKALDIYKNDILLLTDYATGETVKILDAKDIKHKLFNDVHPITIEHPMFSPSDDKVMVLIRQRQNKESISRLAVIFLDDFSFKFLDCTRVSHCCWIDNDTILGFGNIKKIFNNNTLSKSVLRIFSPRLKSIIKKMIGKNSTTPMPFVGDEYFTINTITDISEKFNPFVGLADGHPISSANGDFVVTDTYPNNLGICKLKTWGKLNEINELSIPLDKEYSGKGYRCDLHPKLQIDKNIMNIILDTVINNNRGVAIYTC